MQHTLVCTGTPVRCALGAGAQRLGAAGWCAAARGAVHGAAVQHFAPVLAPRRGAAMLPAEGVRSACGPRGRMNHGEAAACRLQKLFGADGDLADEEFLSAVEDAENQFVAPARLSPACPAARSPAPGPQPLRPLPPQLSHCPGKAPGLRPLTGQREQPPGCWGPLTKGAAPQGELDDHLAAYVELEGSELSAGAGPPPARWEKPSWTAPGQQSPPERAVPKKLRVGEELASSSSGGAEDKQDPLPTLQAAPAPRLMLRPSTAGTCTPRPPAPPRGAPCGSWGSSAAPGGPPPQPFRAPPCQPAASSSGGPQVPRAPVAPAPWRSCPQPRLSAGLPANPPTLMSCVEPLPRQSARPAPGNLQTPVVTNHLVQLVAAASKAPAAVPCLPGKTRRFPGPAGILPQQHSGKLLDEILVSAPQTPAHGALAKPRAEVLPSSSPPTEDFGKGPWLAMKAELKLDERDPSCFLRTYSVVMVLRKAALKQLPKNKVPSMAVMIKTLTRTNVDAGAVFRDPTGEMQGTVHRLLLEERQGELRPGSVLLLRQVGVFSPSHRNHYLNVTPNNLLKIYPPEPEGSFLQQEVHAQAGLLPDHPTQPPQGVPAAGDWGQMRAGACGTEQASGGLSLHSQSPRPGQEELVRADGCDMDDLDGLLGELPEDFFSAPAQADCC